MVGGGWGAGGVSRKHKKKLVGVDTSVVVAGGGEGRRERREKWWWMETRLGSEDTEQHTGDGLWTCAPETVCFCQPVSPQRMQ